MRRSGFNRKPGKPLKRTPLKRSSKPMRRSAIRVAGHSTVSDLKEEIQALLREICLLRDGKCVLYGIKCGHEVGMEGMVWQAEHLIERSNSATYADSRLVVLVERSCHFWKHLKKSNHDQYDEWAKSKMPPERVKLWERCARDAWMPKRTGESDWRLAIVVLKQELAALKAKP